MPCLGKFKREVSRILGGVATGLLLIGLACGAAATATPSLPVAQVATPTPAVRPAATLTPTAAPVAAPIPASSVSPGKITLLTNNLATERFDATYGTLGRDYVHIHGSLIASDVKGGSKVIIPGIATKWEISSDGLTWTYTIRKGVKFHDGTEITAEDVLWSLRHTIGPQAKDYAKGATSIALSFIMDRIEQTGPDRVSVTTKTPAPDFAISTSQGEGSKSAGYVLPRRTTLHDENTVSAYDRNPVGAGIVKLVRHVPLEVMTFERFADHYHQPKNGLPTDKRLNFSLLELRVAPEEATRVAALRAGEADMGRVSLGTRKQVEAGGGRLVFSPEGRAFQILQHGCWNPQFPCHDRRVRQALNYALDKELIRDKLYGGPEVMEVKGFWIVTPSTLGYSPELDPYPFDPVKARQLLAEAGYPGGKRFGNLLVKTLESPFIPFMPEAAQLAADLWRRELGLDVDVKVVDYVALSDTFTNKPEDLAGQVVFGDNNTRMDPASITRSYYLNAVGRGTSFRVYNDSELAPTLKQALEVFDPVEREKLLNGAYRRLRDESYVVNVGYVNIPWGVGPRIARWEPYPAEDGVSALHTITLK